MLFLLKKLDMQEILKSNKVLGGPMGTLHESLWKQTKMTFLYF